MKRVIITFIFFVSVILSSFCQTKIGFALSGGGALGLAHIGAIQALEEHGIFPDYIAGTSMGAIVGALFADGYTAKDIIDYIEKEKLYRLRKLLKMQPILRNQGLSKNSTLHNSLLELMPHNSFDSLKRGFIVCVTNIDEGVSVYKSRGGQLIDYVVASSSVPAAFEPVLIDSVRYVDGGLLDNMPARKLKDMGCEYVVGIDVLPFINKFSTKNSIEMGALGVRLMQHHNSIPGRNVCDWLVEVYSIKEYNELDFKYYKEIYKYGYDAMNEYIKKHPDILALSKSK